MLRGGGFAVLVRHRNIESRDGRPCGARRLEGVERLEAWLPLLLRERRLEALVYVFHDRRAGAEVGGDGEHAVCRLRAERFTRPHVSRNVGAAEAIDRLLGIAHEEERARTQRECRPVVRLAGLRRLAAEAPEDLGLQRVGVLEFVHEYVAEALGQCLAHLVVVPQQVAGGEDQVVEVQ